MRGQIPFVHYGEKAPCKDCEKREEGCHSRCEAYKGWRARRDEHIESEQKKKRGKNIPHFEEKYF